MLDAFASQPHYLDHVAPVFRALPPDRRGAVYVALNVNEFAERAERLGVPITKGRPPPSYAPLILAGGSDLWANQGRPVVLLEHGAGQTYLPDVDNPAYAGGHGRGGVALFCCPNEATAEANRRRYPKARVEVVGAPTVRDRPPRPPRQRPVVAFTWHWHAPSTVPEGRSTWSYWRDAVASLTRDRHRPYAIVGHYHPRDLYRMRAWWDELDVTAIDRWADVAATADVLVCDNSSVMYEIARSGGRVVVLDAPTYRRDVEYGLRFWADADVGVRIGAPRDLDTAIQIAIADPPEVAARRDEIARRVFPVIGDVAAQRSADAIVRLADDSGDARRVTGARRS